MYNAVRPCVTCKHHIKVSWIFVFLFSAYRHECHHPDLVISQSNPVTGGRSYLWPVECEHARRLFEKCGPEGRLYEPLEKEKEEKENESSQKDLRIVST